MGEVDTTGATADEGPQADDAAAASFLSRTAHAANVTAHAAGAGGKAVLRGSRRAAEGVARGEWAYKALTQVAPPAVPVVEPWVLSVGALLGRHPRTPQLVHKALGLLDGFGAVHLGPEGVGFDGEEIPWEKLLEVRTRNAFEVMTTQALEQEVDRIRRFLPPVPGRKWLVTRAAETLGTVVLAALEHGSFDRPLDQIEVPVEIAYKGLLGRRRVLTGGLFAVAGLVVVDQAAESLAATARQHGVPVVAGPPLADSDADRADRVGMLRDRTDAMAEYLARLQREAAAADPAAPASGAEAPAAPDLATSDLATPALATEAPAGPGAPADRVPDPRCATSTDPRTHWAG
ncbi:hypothetical protein [Streptacidiphilus pinicola]|uniref:hypothetical protein n=1 Tax=Streptacidiphilus pinicola TaxID=2219663 RepID=UPI001A9D6CAE|nr:hypothetical protein [Streptacidiphilus pinicola]